MILVVGDNCKDVFIYGDCNRICPEAPVPVFNPSPLDEVENDGMAWGTLPGEVTGNASTATALAANGGNCA